MTDDPIRNVQLNTTDAVYSVKKPSDHEFHRDKKKKDNYQNRKKDRVELSEKSTEEFNVENEKNEDNEKQASPENSLKSVNILVK